LLGYKRGAKEEAPKGVAKKEAAKRGEKKKAPKPAAGSEESVADASPAIAGEPVQSPAPEVAARVDPRTAPVHQKPKTPPPPSDRLPAEPTPDPPGNEHCDGARWRRFVHGLKQIDGLGPVRAALSRSGFVTADEKSITVGFRSASSMRQAEKGRNGQRLVGAMAEAFGEGTVLVLQHDPEGTSGRTLGEELHRREADRRKEMEDEARRDPAIESTRTVFPGARVLNVTLPELKEIEDVG